MYDYGCCTAALIWKCCFYVINILTSLTSGRMVLWRTPYWQTAGSSVDLKYYTTLHALHAQRPTGGRRLLPLTWSKQCACQTSQNWGIGKPVGRARHYNWCKAIE